MMMSSPDFDTPPIEAYGGGGFRVDGKRSEGSILLLPEGAYDWDAVSLEDADATNLAKLLEQVEALEVILIGCGKKMQMPPKALRALFEEHGLGIEVMDTGSACRTYNILISEQRRVGAALIAVA